MQYFLRDYKYNVNRTTYILKRIFHQQIRQFGDVCRCREEATRSENRNALYHHGSSYNLVCLCGINIETRHHFKRLVKLCLCAVSHTRNSLQRRLVLWYQQRMIGMIQYDQGSFSCQLPLKLQNNGIGLFYASALIRTTEYKRNRHGLVARNIATKMWFYSYFPFLETATATNLSSPHLLHLFSLSPISNKHITATAFS